MDTKAALGAAGGIALTVAGGVSALLLAMGASGASPAEVEPVSDEVVTQYIDEAGNPIEAPTPAGTAATPEVVVIGPDGLPVDSPAGEPMADGGMESAEGQMDPLPEGELDAPEEDETEDYEDDEEEDDDD